MKGKTTGFQGVEALRNGVAKIDVASWFERIGIPYTLPVQCAVWFVASFFLGFLFKRLFAFMVILLATVFLTIVLLDYAAIVVVDWSVLQATLGINSQVDAYAVGQLILSWIKSNIPLFLSASFGFLLGCKLG